MAQHGDDVIVRAIARELSYKIAPLCRIRKTETTDGRVAYEATLWVDSTSKQDAYLAHEDRTYRDGEIAGAVRFADHLTRVLHSIRDDAERESKTDSITVSRVLFLIHSGLNDIRRNTTGRPIRMDD